MIELPIDDERDIVYRHLKRFSGYMGEVADAQFLINLAYQMEYDVSDPGILAIANRLKSIAVMMGGRLTGD